MEVATPMPPRNGRWTPSISPPAHTTPTAKTGIAELSPEDEGAMEARDARGRQRGVAEREDAIAAKEIGLPSPLPTPKSAASRSPAPGHDFVPASDSDDSSRSQSTGNSSGESAISEHAMPEPEPVPDPAAATSGLRRRNSSSTKSPPPNGVRRLSASKIQELTESLPIAAIADRLPPHPLSAGIAESGSPSMAEQLQASLTPGRSPIENVQSDGGSGRALHFGRPAASSRTLSTPPTVRRKSSSQPPANSSTRRNSAHPAAPPLPLSLESGPTPVLKPTPSRTDTGDARSSSPALSSIPLPPMSVPTVLQLELAGQRPSPLYIHHSYTADVPYESSAVKFERLKNFLLLPSFLERTMVFGALACLDAWLWTLTILPMRFCMALGVLVRWWAYVLGKEVRWLTGFVWMGLGRMWTRGRRGRAASRSKVGDGGRSSEDSRSRSRVRESANGNANGTANGNATVAADGQTTRRPEGSRLNSNNPVSRPVHPKMAAGAARHRRTKSIPSSLTSFHKADLLQGAVVLVSSVALMHLDASRMYHFIRAQSAVKLYVVYNLVEVGDRLLSALGQDIFECLFSAETLSRTAAGRSKILLPFAMFLLALVYNIAHTMVLFYQVITLNVAVNSYSNALLSLLMSNQFVEVKSSVFKRCEKENTFQLTLADIVERFQLWIVLLIIAMRNIVEVGGFSVPGAGVMDLGNLDDAPIKVPLHNASILPASFTLLPSWLASGEVLSPFLIVIGSEMMVDWVKHAYINKFNNIKPNFYGRILDILCKDYYTNAFVTPSLTRRLGLPLLPLACLFIRASVQTYHMFLATYLPMPLPPSTQTSLSVESTVPTSPAIAATLERLDTVIRSALGRAVFGSPYTANAPTPSAASTGFFSLFRLANWSSDDAIAAAAMLLVFFLVFLALLVCKLLLGMLLLAYSRNRYARMKAAEAAVAAGKAEPETFEAAGRRVGAHAEVEVGEERRRWIFADDPEGLRKLREKEARDRGKGKKEVELGNIRRYEMVAKRIW